MKQQATRAGGPITIAEAQPTADQYIYLRKQAARGDTDPHAAETALGHSLYSVCALRDNRVIGCGRIVGDGGLYFYIQDLLVDDEHRGRGVGGLIVRALLAWLHANASDGAFIGLVACADTAGFYRRFGFLDHPEDRAGMYLPPDRLQSGSLISPSK